MDVLKYDRKRLWRLCYVTCIKLIETVSVNGTGLDFTSFGYGDQSCHHKLEESIFNFRRTQRVVSFCVACV